MNFLLIYLSGVILVWIFAFIAAYKYECELFEVDELSSYLMICVVSSLSYITVAFVILSVIFRSTYKFLKREKVEGDTFYYDY